MNMPEYRLLRAEVNTLDDLMNRLPEESLLERISLEFRKRQVEEELASMPDNYQDQNLVRRLQSYLRRSSRREQRTGLHS